MRYKYLISTSHSPYLNLAMEQLLMGGIDAHSAIVFFWQNADTVVVGRNQDVYAECRVEAFLADGGTIARRKSGGGAVYHDLGNLCYSIISSVQDAGECDYRALIRDTLLSMGILAVYNGRNDLVADGRKFSGNAAYTHGQAFCQHGTVLIDTDLGRMSRYLTPDAEKLKRNAVGSVRSRVMNLKEISQDISVESFCRACLERYGMEPLGWLPHGAGQKDLAEAYRQEEWIYRGKMV